MRLTAIKATVDEDSSSFQNVLPLSIVKTYLQTGGTPPYCSTLTCKRWSTCIRLVRPNRQLFIKNHYLLTSIASDECFHSRSTDREKYCIGMHPHRSLTTMQIRYERVRIRSWLRMSPQEHQFMQRKGQLVAGMRFLHRLNCTCFKIKRNNDKYYVFMKIRPLIGRRIRISRRLHVNQPQHITRLRNFLKFPKASINVQKTHLLPLDAQVELAFVIEIMSRSASILLPWHVIHYIFKIKRMGYF